MAEKKWTIKADTLKELNEALDQISKELVGPVGWNYTKQRMPDGSYQADVHVWHEYQHDKDYD